MLVKYLKKYTDFVNGKNHLWVTFCYFLFAVFMTIVFIYFPDMRDTHFLVFIFFNALMLGWPILIVVSHIVNFRNTLYSLRKLASLYFQIILMFGVIYYFGSALSVTREMKNRQFAASKIHTPIRGIDTDWVKMAVNRTGNKSAMFREALISFQDCIHFSLITSTTVGYGDIVPVSPMAKLLVDIQVLVSCFLLAFGVGSFFNSDKIKLENKINKLTLDMEKLLAEQEKKNNK